MTFKLVVANKSPVIRAGLATFFPSRDVEICADVSTGVDAISAALTNRADAALIGSAFADLDAFQVVGNLRDANFCGAIILFADRARSDSLARALALGADSFLTHDVPRETLLRVIVGLCKCERRDLAEERAATLTPFAGELLRVGSALRRRAVASLNPLTARETQVLRHVASGLSNKEIAASLQLSLDTVKEHVQNILRKLDVNDRTQAVVWAIRNKVIH